MNRSELAKVLADKLNMSTKSAEKLIVAFGDTVASGLAEGDRIVFSNFGTFYTVHYPSKVIYHPKLGAAKKMVMLPTNAVKWMPSGNVKEAVKQGEVKEFATMHGSATKKWGLFRRKEEPAENISNNNQQEEEVFDIPVKASSTKIGMDPRVKPEDDEINGPEKDKNKNSGNTTIQPSNHSTIEPPVVFAEKTKDGGQEDATFDGVIQLHKKPGFFSKMFGRREDFSATTPSKVDNIDTTEVQKEKISLVDSGMFGKDMNASIHPQPSQFNKLGEDSKEQGEKTPNSKLFTPDSQLPTPHSDDEVAIPVKATGTRQEVDSMEQGENAPHSPLPTPDSPDESIQFHNSYVQNTEEKPAEKNVDETTAEEKIKAIKKDVSFIDLSAHPIDKKLLQKIPEHVARKYKLAPVEETEEEFIVAMVDPEDIEAIDIIKKYVQKTVVVKQAMGEDISHVLDQYNGLETELKDAIEAGEEGEKSTEGQEGLVESASDTAPAARIVASILRRAIREKASDIHIEPTETEVEVRFRIDGILMKKVVLPKKLQSGAISRIKIMSDLKIDEQRLPQDGRFSINIDDRKVDFRVSTMPVAYGEKVVMRILDKITGILAIDQLGIRGKAQDILQENLKKSHGMILITGPTGSGKTTTLYALLTHLFSDGVNIVTLEDPIEYQISGINQSQVNPDIDYTFASGLRSIVRQDPDIIMIGEIRDGETADMAIHAALTGHIVLSTLHTNNSAGAVPRLIDMGVEPFLLNSSLNMVIGQRLARQICDNCKKEIQIEPGELEEINKEIDHMPEEAKAKIDRANMKFYHGEGCEKCGKTGYHGRIGLYEVLGVTEEIKSLILSKASSAAIEQQAIKEGMTTMLQDGILKALDGITTIEDVWRVTKE